MGTLVQDLRYGIRMLAKNPGFTAVAVITLALGIGANTGLFSTMNAILLRSPLLGDPSRVMVILPQNAAKGSDTLEASRLDFAIWGDHSHVFEAIAASSFRPVNLSRQGQAQRLQATEVTVDYFRVMGVSPALGRTFEPGEDQPGRQALVVLSHELWEQSFGSDPTVLGKPVSLDGEPATVVGVMPPGFELPFFPSRIWLLAPATSRTLSPEMGEKRFLVVLARLKHGVTVEAAHAEIATIARQIEHDYPRTHRGWVANVMPLQKYLIRIARVEGRLALMTGGLIFVLLIACANVAGLLLARGESRRHEMAIRAALGAGRQRLIRQLLVESLPLALLGGGLGLMISAWWLDAFRTDPGLTEVPKYWVTGLVIDRSVLAFTLALSTITALLCGLVPALEASTPHLHTALKEGGRAGAEGPSPGRLRRILVTGEFALTLVLMTGAALMTRNFIESSSAGLQFDTDRVLTADLSLSGSSYEEPNKQAAFFQQVLERVGALPGVQSAAVASNLPLNYTWQTTFGIEGRPSLTPGEGLQAGFYIVSPGYFRTMGIPLVEGRTFTESDGPRAPAVALVNEALVHRFFSSENPLVRRITVEAAESRSPVWREIVGVVGNVKEWPGQPTDDPQIYVPYLQRPHRSLLVVLRASGKPGALAPVLRSAVRAVDQNQSVENVMTMTQVLAKRLGSNRIASTWMTFFACVALVLAAVGIYGTVAYSVSRRTREVGIRMALGAERHQVLNMILREGIELTGIGLLAGLVAAFPLPWVLASAIPRFAVRGSWVYVAVPILVAMVALLATYIPARRATKVDPMVALRYE